MEDGSAYLLAAADRAGRRLADPGSPVRVVAIAPTGDRAASGHEDGGVQVYELDEEVFGVTTRLVGHHKPVNALAFAPGGWRLASGGEDRTVRLWDLGSTTGREPGRPQNHTGWVQRVEFSPDGGEVHTYSIVRPHDGIRSWMLGETDDTHRTWDAATGLLLRTECLSSDRREELFRTWDREQPAAGSPLERLLRRSVRPPATVPPPSRWRAEAGPDGTVIYQDGERVAVYPVALEPLAQHPTDPVWAGADGPALHLIALEPWSRTAGPGRAGAG